MSRRVGGGRFRTAVLGSGALHFVVVAGFLGLSSRVEDEPRMRVYAVDLVSPPPQVLGPPVAGVPEPEPEPVPEEAPEEPEKPEPKPEPKPTPPPPAKQTQAVPQRPAQRPETRQERNSSSRREQSAERPPQQASTPSSGRRPDPNSPGGEDINVRLSGVTCPSVDYCDNIVRQINRYFRNPGGNGGVAEVFFAIRRDGSISTDLRLQSSTGSAAFRLAVLEAVERAGRDKAFGPLPREFQTDQLPVLFSFRPAQ